MNPEDNNIQNYSQSSEAGISPAAGKRHGRKFSMVKKIVWLVIILAIAAVGYYGYKYYQQKRLANPQYQQAQVDKQIKQLTAAVSQMMILPTGETPTVATINDAAKLKAEQPFYADAENGDQLLVYPQARKAIIYSSKRGKIINAGPVYVQDEKKAEAPAPTPVPTKKK